MDFEILLCIACIILACGLIAISLYMLRIVSENNAYLRFKQDANAFERTAKKPKLNKKKAKEVNDEREWFNMNMSGVITDEQIKKFGETIDEI